MKTNTQQINEGNNNALNNALTNPKFFNSVERGSASATGLREIKGIILTNNQERLDFLINCYDDALISDDYKTANKVSSQKIIRDALTNSKPITHHALIITYSNYNKSSSDETATTGSMP
jgi:CTP:phosphocholine cytidylyltransferase-like protein